MSVILAKTAGFCFGVKNALELVYKTIDENKEGRRIYTYGPIIHNDEVIRELEEAGVYAIEGDLRGLDENSTLIIRSHGVGRAVYEEAEKRGARIIDATCPFVKKIHEIVRSETLAGKHVIIAGDGAHPEVMGIVGWACGPVTVVKDEEEAAAFYLSENIPVSLVFQTTFNSEKFQYIVEIIRKKGYDTTVNNTICSATRNRQKEAFEISKQADAMIVIGDKKSSNSKKLYEICRSNCSDTYFIQTVTDLPLAASKPGICVGITAGASTPKHIIQEVFCFMSDEMIFNDQMIDESIKQIRTGEVVDGVVLDVKPDYIVLNINYKYDGIITKNEYSNDPVDLTAVVNVGDTMEAKVLRIQDSEVQLSYKRLGEEKANKRIEEAYENKEVLNVKVEKITSGGLICEYEGAKIFVPASLISDIYEKDLSKYLGQEIEVIITEYNPKKRRVIGNRKKIILEVKAEKAKELLETLQVNDILEGEVKSVTSYGAFVDLGGVDGLLHISEISWGRIDSPKSVLNVGDSIRVFIKSIQDGKIALSAKFPDENPWVLAKEKYLPGTIVKGKVLRMADFGAFIELEPGIDALLHVSQISKKHVKKPSDVLSVGQEIEVKVVEFKEEEKKISLSRRDFDDDLVPDEVPQEEKPEETQEAEAPVAEEIAAQEAPEAAPEEAVTEEAPEAEQEAPAQEETPAEE